MPTLQEDADSLVVIASRIRAKAKKQATLTRGPLEDCAAQIEAIARHLPPIAKQARAE